MNEQTAKRLSEARNSREASDAIVLEMEVATVWDETGPPHTVYTRSDSEKWVKVDEAEIDRHLRSDVCPAITIARTAARTFHSDDADTLPDLPNGLSP